MYYLYRLDRNEKNSEANICLIKNYFITKINTKNSLRFLQKVGYRLQNIIVSTHFMAFYRNRFEFQSFYSDSSMKEIGRQFPKTSSI